MFFRPVCHKKCHKNSELEESKITLVIMADIEIKPIALFILTKGPSLLKNSFFGVGGGAAPPKIYFFTPGA